VVNKRSKVSDSIAHVPYGLAAARQYMVTTVRITEDHWEWLRDRAHERAKLRHGGRADASEIVRELIDEAIRASR